MQFSKVLSASAALLGTLVFAGPANAQTVFSSAVNSVSVSSSVTDPKSGNDSASDTDLPNVVNLSVVKTIKSGAGPYVPGETGSNVIVYEVVLKNEGPVDANGLSFRDSYMASGLTSSWSCKDGGAACSGANVVASGNNVDIVWNDFSLEAGQTLTIDMSVTMDSSFTGNGSGGDFCGAGQIENRAWLLTDEAGDGKTIYDKTDVNGDDEITSVDKKAYEFVKDGDATGEDDNSDFACANLTIKADLAAAKDDGLTYYTPGTNSIYTLRAWNHGPADATAVVLTDTLPAGISSVGAVVCVLYNAPGGGDDTIPAGSMTVPANTIGGTANLVVNIPRIEPFGPGAPAGLPTFSGASSDQYLECLVPVTWSTDPGAY